MRDTKQIVWYAIRKAFILGVALGASIVLSIEGFWWNHYAVPWLQGVSYNMQLDEAALRSCGIQPISNEVWMRQQTEALP